MGFSEDSLWKAFADHSEIISQFLHEKKTWVVGTHKKRLSVALLMSAHYICFYKEMRNYPGITAKYYS